MEMECPTIVRKADWNADQVLAPVTNLDLPVHQIVLIQTGYPVSCNTLDSCKKDVKKVQLQHMNPKENHWSDIGYNFLIGGEGTIFEGRGWNVEGAFYKGQNKISYGIAFMGSYGSLSSDKPSSVALNSSVRLVHCALSLKHLNKTSLKYTSYNLNPEVLQDFRRHPDAPVEASMFSQAPSTTHLQITPDLGTASTPFMDTPTLKSAGIPIVTVSLAASGLFVLLSLIFGVFWWRRRDKKKVFHSQICTRVPAHVLNYYRISRNALVIQDGKNDRLGSGNFGVVVKGRLKHRSITDSGAIIDCEVAVKMLHIKITEKSGSDNLFLEMEMLMKTGRHVNIVNLIGVVLEDRPLIVMEYCSLGSLENYLQNPKNVSFTTDQAAGVITSRSEERYVIHNESIYDDRASADALTGLNDLINIGFQISRGMAFVSARNIIHRDLAARNILLDATRTAKIADFGMAREETLYILERQNVELPMRWLALESIVTQSSSYSVKTDVWSFGVTLWEIFSLCRMLPYKQEFPGGLQWNVLVEFLSRGERLAQPAYCPDGLFEIMMQCWAADPHNRRTFAEITLELSSLLPREMQHQYLVLDQENDSFNHELNQHYENSCRL